MRIAVVPDTALPSTKQRSRKAGAALIAAAVAGLLLIRVLSDNAASPGSRHSGSVNLSGVIAVILIGGGALLLLRHRSGLLSASLAGAWLVTWTLVAVVTHGATAETVREGVRETSIVALGYLVYNARDSVTVPTAARILQLAGVVPALLALYQLATHTGMTVDGHVRSNGTFAHPNSAALYFGLAAVASLWLYVDAGRNWGDGLLAALFLAALVSTFSIDGLITVAAMLGALSVFWSGPRIQRLIPCVVAVATILVFFATPLGASRVATESETSLSTAERGEANSTLAWRLNKWKTLLPIWEDSRLLGRASGPPSQNRIGTRTSTPVIRPTMSMCAISWRQESLVSRFSFWASLSWYGV